MKFKKHKVKIPKGYILVNESKTKIDGFMTITLGLEPISMEQPKKDLPETWEEYLSIENKCRPSISNLIVPPKYSMAFKSLARLIELRDHYNDGWEPDWRLDSGKYIIYITSNSISAICLSNTAHVLAFKTEELRDEFLSNFRDLIEIAKHLL